MATIEQQIQSAHNWVKTVNRDFMPRGHKPLGESSTVVDQIYIPFLDTTYVLVFASSWATTGGTKQNAVLLAYDHRTGERRTAESHTIFNGRDPMSSFYPQKIGATIRFVTRDYPSLESWEYGVTLCGHFGPGPRSRFGRQILRAGAFTRESWVGVNISMYGRADARACCKMVGCYETGRVKERERRLYGNSASLIPVSSREWTTGEVESSVLTKKNISRFYRKYIAELPEIPETGAG